METFYSWAFDAAQFVRENPFMVFVACYFLISISNIRNYLDILNAAINEPFVIKKIAETKNGKLIINIVLVVGLIFMLIFYTAVNLFFIITNIFKRK